MSTSAIVLAAPSWTGKTTSAEAGRTVDPENDPEYLAAIQKPGDARRQAAYKEATLRLLESDHPFVTVHPGLVAHLLKHKAIQVARVRLVLPPFTTLFDRALKYRTDPNFARRFDALARGIARVHQMAEEYGLPIYPDLISAERESNAGDYESVLQ